MMGLHFMKEVPFRVVYLHPMVRDDKGQKMSKTKGNVIDPLVITEQQGADALRFTLAALTAQGRDIKLAKERIEGYRAFANKLWNASRFAFMNLTGHVHVDGDAARLGKGPAERWILARLQRVVNETLDALEGYRFNDAANTIYAFVWHELCDWYIELSKDALYGEDPGKKRAAQAVLAHCLETALRLLHPIMPFITEELWQTLRKVIAAEGWVDSIMVAPYPSRGPVDEEAERGFGPVLGIVDALRNIRGEMNIPFKTPLRGVELGGLEPGAWRTVGEELSRIVRLANVQGLSRAPASQPLARRKGSAAAVGSGFEVSVPLAGIVDMAGEQARIAKELSKVESDLGGIERKLGNPSFVEKAPPEVVEKDRARAEELRGKRKKLEEHRAMLEEAEMEQPKEQLESVSSGAPVVPVEAAPAVVPPVESPAASVEVPAPKAEAKPVKKAAAKKPAAKKAPVKAAAPAKKPAAKAKPAKKAVAKKAVAKKPAAKKPAKKVAKAKPAKKAAKAKVAPKAANRVAKVVKKLAKVAKKVAKKGRW